MPLPKKPKPKRLNRQTDAIRKFLVDQVERHPQDLVLVAMRRFQMTRPAVHRHLAKLIASGDLIKQGTKNTTVYSRATQILETKWSLPIGREGDESTIWERDFLPKISSYNENIHDICYYGVTEMINNVIDHSLGKRLTLSWNDEGSEIKISIHDDGIGIFRKISGALNLGDVREAVLHLSKGKFTTDTKNHTGQGIFFTSRMFDRFVLMSYDLVYMRTRAEEDWLVETRKDSGVAGTLVQMVLSKNTDLTSIDVFRKYEDEDHGFEKTDVFVKLAKLEEEAYISRSQARRLLLGLEKFKSVVLDFSDVRSVGQGFVDEVFRVFKNAHPEIKISYIHANDDVEFMIRRGLIDAKRA